MLRYHLMGGVCHESDQRKRAEAKIQWRRSQRQELEISKFSCSWFSMAASNSTHTHACLILMCHAYIMKLEEGSEVTFQELPSPVHPRTSSNLQQQYQAASLDGSSSWQRSMVQSSFCLLQPFKCPVSSSHTVVKSSSKPLQENHTSLIT